MSHSPIEPGEAASGRTSLSEKIYVDLRLALMSGAYEPGARLNIRKLAAAHMTSATPVREAIMQLVREGALKLQLGHQPRVPVLTPPQYVKIRDTRAPLERLAAELASVHVTDEMLGRLAELHQAFGQAEQRESWKEALGANQEFHFTIYRASGNDVLVRVIENLWLLSGPFITNQYPAVRLGRSEAHPHVLIIDALRRQAPGEVGDLVVHDLRQGSFLILEHLRRDGGRRRRAPRKAAIAGS
jgi:DNA-binding GntR family transcriptional regulator